MAKKKNKAPSKKPSSGSAKKPAAKPAAKPTPQTKAPAAVLKPVAAQKPVTPTTQKIPQQQALTTGPLKLFPTVCFIHQQPNAEKMNEELKKIILASEVKGTDLPRSAIKGGYRSDRTFLDTNNWAVQDLRKIITATALRHVREFWKNESSTPLEKVSDFRMKLSGWSVILRDGSAGAPHIHPRANLSGVYYVSVPPDKPSYRGAGNLVLADPRIRASVAPVRDQVSSVMIPPKPGLMVIFPSYVEHYILPFKGDGTRVSVAFNLTFSPNALSRGY